ncbi:putative pentatricopeptide repeat-containing protein-like isoform X1 [Capsicum annuum]|nr:putative pentatricopeptide repeat-containing protein-like isoform X1 [Capsicum annuum]
MVTVRSVLAMAASRRWHVQQMDIYNVFLQEDLVEEVYMTLRKRFHYDKKGDNKVYRLVKSLYGLKQASRQWNVKLINALVAAGFTQSHLDYSLLTKKYVDGIVVILIYVDDLLVTCSSMVRIEDAKQVLKDNFKIKDLGDLKYFLGIEFARSLAGILMHQRKYALELISDLGLGRSKPINTPVEINLKMTAHEFDNYFGDSFNSLIMDPSDYQRLVGRLLYPIITKPDIYFVVQHLSQFMHASKISHMTAAIRIVKYVKQAPGLAEAEYRSLASTVAEIVWIAGLFKELDMSLSLPVSLFCDSKAAIQIVANPVFYERTKHIDIDCHFIREKVQDGLVLIQYLSTKEQPADILTKGLGCLVFSSSLPHLCANDQALALLQFKNMFSINPSGYCIGYSKTLSWNKSIDCCSWDGVHCDEMTGQVIELDLSCSRLQGKFHSNSSLFQLSNLKRLYLSNNDFSGSLISPKFGEFSSLTHLDLSYSGFTGPIPSEITHLSKLYNLHFKNNDGLRFEPLNFELLLKNLTQLRELNLFGVNFSSTIPLNFSSYLTTLDLSNTELYGILPERVFQLPNLESLYLSYNPQLTVRFPSTKWNSSASLMELGLSGVNATGRIPESFSHLTSLRYLDVSFSNLSGPIPRHLWNLTNIEYLNLD